MSRQIGQSQAVGYRARPMCPVRPADRLGGRRQDKGREVRRGRIAEEHGKISGLRRGAFLRPRLQFSASPRQNRSSLHLASRASVRATNRLALILHSAGHTSPPAQTLIGTATHLSP